MGNPGFNPSILSQRSERAIGMGRNERLSAQQIKTLTDELEALTKQQADARELEIYVRATSKDLKDFNARQERISAISIALRNTKAEGA
jgi:hypothetical protein